MLFFLHHNNFYKPNVYKNVSLKKDVCDCNDVNCSNTKFNLI